MTSSPISHINEASDDLTALLEFLDFVDMAAAALPDQFRPSFRVAVDQAQSMASNVLDNIEKAKECIA